MSGLLLGVVLSVCTCWFHNMVTLPPWIVYNNNNNNKLQLCCYAVAVVIWHYYYYYYYYYYWRSLCCLLRATSAESFVIPLGKDKYIEKFRFPVGYVKQICIQSTRFCILQSFHLHYVIECFDFWTIYFTFREVLLSIAIDHTILM